MSQPLSCFKAYDIRGKLGIELNEDIAYRIGRSFALYTQAKTVVIGGDIRETSPILKQHLAQGLIDQGCLVYDLGQVATEEIYFATSHLDVDGGIMVTASHNPIDYNGMKLVTRGSQPLFNDNGLNAIKEIAEHQTWQSAHQHEHEQNMQGRLISHNVESHYLQHLMGYIEHSRLTPLKIVTNAGNGTAGKIIDLIEAYFFKHQVPIEFVKIHHQADPSFPHGIPNPLLPENRSATAQAVIAHQADLGIAWDGDADRCFLFDEQGQFIEGYYIVGLLAEAFLRKHPREKIIYDPRVYWNTEAVIARNQGKAIQSKTGHAFIKQAMRDHDAIYGGEMSAHHYFRDFFYCDSGMIPWLLITELVCEKQVPLSQLVGQYLADYPSSGEINFKVQSTQACLALFRQHPWQEQYEINELDGLDICFKQWRFNVRASNTEPVLRLNVEAKEQALMQEKLSYLCQLLAGELAGEINHQ